MSPELTPLQSQVLAGLLSGASVAAVAREHKIHRSTIYAWRNDHVAFRYALQSARACQKVVLYDAAQDLAARAFETLAGLLSSESEATRLRAAQAVLRSVNPVAADTPPPESRTSTAEVLTDRFALQHARESLLPEDRQMLDCGTLPLSYPDVRYITEPDTIRQNPTLSAPSKAVGT